MPPGVGRTVSASPPRQAVYTYLEPTRRTSSSFHNKTTSPFIHIIFYACLTKNKGHILHRLKDKCRVSDNMSFCYCTFKTFYRSVSFVLIGRTFTFWRTAVCQVEQVKMLMMYCSLMTSLLTCFFKCV